MCLNVNFDFQVHFPVKMRTLTGEVSKMRKSMRQIIYDLAQRGSAVVSDPAPIITDPNGSYTGRPADPQERPIQDADDL